jgi:NADPH:quinone reductase-like Zn-dependent oxidoreductase
MKAFVRDRYGSPEVLVLEDVERPTVGDDDLLVRVVASSLNQGDLDYLYGRPLLTRMGIGLGRPRGRGLGFDVAGRVEAVGTRASMFRVGDEVFGDLTQFGHGAFAEYAGAPQRAWALKPPSLSYEETATLPQAAILAVQALLVGGRRPSPGDRVLVNGASGSVGPFVVQIAKAWGARVTGVCRTSKVDFVRGLGADEIIDYTGEDYTRSRRRYDWIVDVAGNRSLLDCRRVLAPRGVYMMVGGSTGRICACLFAGPVISLAERKRAGFLWWKPFRASDVVVLKELIEAGSVRPVIDRSYPLAELPDALRYLEGGHAHGKVVITM